MSLNTSDWETNLYNLALQGLHLQNPSNPVADSGRLAQAYAYCDALTREHSRTFHLASGLLPPSKRAAVRVLYAFCRVSDDIVDRPTTEPIVALEAWQQRSTGGSAPQDDLVALAWADVRFQYRIPLIYARQLIDGIREDITRNRYQDFSELAAYAYKVASTVGLMSMHIIGHTGSEAIPYAIKMGVALQLTNILRDIAEDWECGRLYLPQDELDGFGLSEADIAAGLPTPRWQAFMAYQIERNRRLYEESWPGIAMLNPDGKLAIAAASRLYAAILDDIERHDYDVFSRRAYVSNRSKVTMLPGIWHEVRQL